MICGLTAAALMAFTISRNVADNMVALGRFTDPIDVANYHAAVYLGCNIAGLAVGWLLAAVLTYPLRRKT